MDIGDSSSRRWSTAVTSYNFLANRLHGQRLLDSRGSGYVLLRSCLVVFKIWGRKLRWREGGAIAHISPPW